MHEVGLYALRRLCLSPRGPLAYSGDGAGLGGEPGASGVPRRLRPVIGSTSGCSRSGESRSRVPVAPGRCMLSSPLLAQAASDVLSVDDVLSPYIFVFYVAFIVTFIMTPLMRVV